MVIRVVSRKILYGILGGIVLWLIALAFNFKFQKIPHTKVTHGGFQRNIDLLRPVEAVIKPHLKRKNIFLMVVVLSAPNHFDKRQAIRSTWANHSSFNSTDNGTFQVFFLLGRSNTTEQNKAEHTRYNDIVMGDFNDTYWTLVSKTFLGIRWAMKDVNFKYLVKCDDDVYFNIPRLFKWLHTERVMFQRNLYAGHVNHRVVPVRENYKNALSESEYSRNYFPPYAAGPVYILSRSSVQLILEASREVKPFFIEDAYIGCLAEHAGIQPFEMDIFALTFSAPLQFLDYGTCELLAIYVFGHNLSASYLKKLHAKVLQFESLDSATASVMCFQEWLLFLYKLTAVIITAIILAFGLVWLISSKIRSRSLWRRK